MKEDTFLHGNSAKTELALEMDQQLEVAEEAYRILQTCLQEWQAESHPALADWISKRTAKPYFTLGDLPEEPVLDLWQRLNQRIHVEIRPDVLAQNLKAFKEGQNVDGQEMLTRLYFAFSGVASWLRTRLPEAQLKAAADRWQEAACPICGEDTRYSILVPPVGKRELFCRVCGHTWPGKRVGCIVCGSEDASNQTYLNSPEFPGLNIAFCEECGEYFKEIDLRIRAAEDLVWEDVRTLPLNYAVEQWIQAERAGKPTAKPQ